MPKSQYLNLPWKVRETDDEDTRVIYVVPEYTTLGPIDLACCNKNEAELFVSVPLLLDALKDLVSLYASSPGFDEAFVKKGQAAIAKALGGVK